MIYSFIVAGAFLSAHATPPVYPPGNEFVSGAKYVAVGPATERQHVDQWSSEAQARAEEWYRKVEPLEKSSNKLVEKARAKWDEGDVKSAANLFEAAATQIRLDFPDDANRILTESLLMQGKYADVPAFARRDQPELWLAIADAEIGNLGEAIHILGRWLQPPAPGEEPIFFQLPMAFEVNARTIEATARLATFRMNIVNSHSYAGCVRWLRTIDALTPHNLDVDVEIGRRLFYIQGQRDKSIPYLEDALPKLRLMKGRIAKGTASEVRSYLDKAYDDAQVPKNRQIDMSPID